MFQICYFKREAVEVTCTRGYFAVSLSGCGRETNEQGSLKEAKPAEQPVHTDGMPIVKSRLPLSWNLAFCLRVLAFWYKLHAL